MRASLRKAPPGESPDARALLAALGGPGNVHSVEVGATTRILVRVLDDAGVDEHALAAASPRGFARPAAGRVHVLVGPGVGQAREALERARSEGSLR
jgi:PTS system N-acetylglucosamine-specific IIC component